MDWLQNKNSRYGRYRVVGSGLLLLGALSIFVIRGPERGFVWPVDYAVAYSEARAWLAGLNPYDHDVLDHVFEDAGGPRYLKPVKGYTSSVQSPSLLPVAALTAWLPWRTALTVWITMLIAAYVTACCAISVASCGISLPQVAVLIGLGLSFSPSLAGFSVGQPSVLAIALVLSAFVLPLSGYPRLSGVALGLAICIKPQLGIPFLLAIASKHGRRMLVAALLTTVLVTMLGATPLTLAHPDWPSTLRNNIEVTFAVGQTNEPSAANPDSWRLLNFQVVLSLFLHSRTAVNVLTVVLVGLGALTWWHYRHCIFEVSFGRASVSLLALSSLTLLVVYHRNYDAALLLFALPAIRYLWQKGRRPLALALTALTVPFTMPLPAYLVKRFPAWETSSPADISGQLILRHQVVLLALLACTTLYAMRLDSREQGVQTEPEMGETRVAKRVGL